MSEDLRKAIGRARRAVRGQRIPPRTLLGKKLYGSLASAETALKNGDGVTVQRELDSIQQLLAQF